MKSTLRDIFISVIASICFSRASARRAIPCVWSNVDSLENCEFSSHAFFSRCYFPREFFSRHAFPRYTIPWRKLSRREFLVTHSPSANLLCHGFSCRKRSRPAFSRLIFFRRVFHQRKFLASIYSPYFHAFPRSPPHHAFFHYSLFPARRSYIFSLVSQIFSSYIKFFSLHRFFPSAPSSLHSPALSSHTFSSRFFPPSCPLLSSLSRNLYYEENKRRSFAVLSHLRVRSLASFVTLCRAVRSPAARFFSIA